MASARPPLRLPFTAVQFHESFGSFRPKIHMTQPRRGESESPREQPSVIKLNYCKWHEVVRDCPGQEAQPDASVSIEYFLF